MTDNQNGSDALLAATPTSISELSPDLPDMVSRVIDGSVTITWPFSASKRLLAFVLADHDFRKRRNKGQVRLEFHGASGRTLEKAKIASGDTVRLSLDGAEWQKQDVSQSGLSGEPLGWQLNFSRKLRLSLRRLDGDEDEAVTVDSEEADESIPSPADDATTPSLSAFLNEPAIDPPAPQTPMMNVSTKRLASTAFENLEEFVSPAFLKRAKVSYGSLFEGGIDALEEESTKRDKKGRRKSRFSMPTAAWRYSSRSPSPEKEEDNESAASEEEMSVPGLAFSSKLAGPKWPELKEPTGHALGQPETDTQGASALSQASTTLQSSEQGHFALPQDPPASDHPATSTAFHQEQVMGSIPVNWMPDSSAQLQSDVDHDEPASPNAAAGFAFGMEADPLQHMTHDQHHHQLYVPVSTDFTYNIPPTTATVAGQLPFAMEIQHDESMPIDTTLGQSSYDAGLVLQHEEHDGPEDNGQASTSPPVSVISQPATGIRSQPVDTIEILSSSPVQTPSISRQTKADYSSQQSPDQDSDAAHLEMAESAASDEEPDDHDDESSPTAHTALDQFRHQAMEQETAENDEDDEDAEGAEQTHDPTSEDDIEVPGEDYDLRKYDDAQEDDEEGNIDRDSLLSTDGEGGIVPNQGEVMSTGNSDSEDEEGAALDVDDNEAGDVTHVHDVADDYDSEVEDEDLEDYDGLSDGQGYDEDEEHYDDEDLQSESAEEDEMEEPSKPQQPVFIDLLSDSEDEDDNQVPAKSGLSTQTSAVAAPLLPVEGETDQEEVSVRSPEDRVDQRQGQDVGPKAPELEEQAAPDVDMGDAPTDVPAVALVDVLDDASDHDEPMPGRDEQPEALDTHPVSDGDEPGQETEMADSNENEYADPKVNEPGKEEGTPSPPVAAETPARAPADASLDPRGATPEAVIEVHMEGAAEVAPKTSREIPLEATAEDVPGPDLVMVENGSEEPGADLEVTRSKTMDELQQDGPNDAATAPAPDTENTQPEPFTSQAKSTQGKYQTQPPMSFDLSGTAQTEVLTQTVVDSQTQVRFEPESEPDHVLDVPQSTQKDEEVDKTVEAKQQQLMMPIETQEVDPADEVSLVEVPEGEHSPGPDDQLHLEMQQWRSEADAKVSQRTEDTEHIITEEDELAAIEDEAEHDPSLAEKDLIITVDSLRSHDHKDEGSVKPTGDESQTVVDQEARPIDKTPPRLRARVPPKASHRKTRSQGSVDILTGETAVPSSPGLPVQQVQNRANEVPDGAEAPKTPPRLRASRRKGAMRHLNVDAASAPQQASRESVQENESAEPARELRSSPRATKHGKEGDAASDRETPMSPSGAESSQTTETTRNTKAQLLKILHTELPEFLSLKVLRNSLHRTVDILGVAASTPTAPVRPKNGPRDYMLELILTDPSTAPSSVSVAQIYRPHQKSLPVVRAGDVVLLRRFQVLSMKGRGFGIRAGDDSSWAVFEKDDEEKLPQIMGPPLEVTNEEVGYASALAEWWNGVGDDVRSRAEKVGEKAMTVSGAGK
ncbi:telomeric single stranded DNA binding POT1/CDC13 domain-containing protein [Sarocladium implicatum]|nr:telomeric single stranded DNA binding POT1/CDC13 domain-containing protein [Sarocladium implicatum]